MATQVLTAHVDEEIVQRLNRLIEEIGVDRDAVIAEALKHYLCGRVPSGARIAADRASALQRDVQVSMK